MKTQIVSATMGEMTVKEVLAAIQALREKVPFAVQLTNEEKRKLPKITSGTAYFVEDSLESARQNPTLLPLYVDLEEMARDLELYNQLSRILTPLRQFSDLLDSTAITVGSEAFTAALSYYNSVKQAAKSGVPGAQTVYEKLRRRFEQSGATVPVAAAAPKADPNPTAVEARER